MGSSSVGRGHFQIRYVLFFAVCFGNIRVFQLNRCVWVSLVDPLLISFFLCDLTVVSYLVVLSGFSLAWQVFSCFTLYRSLIS